MMRVREKISARGLLVLSELDRHPKSTVTTARKLAHEVSRAQVTAAQQGDREALEYIATIMKNRGLVPPDAISATTAVTPVINIMIIMRQV